MKLGVSSYSFAKLIRNKTCNYIQICDMAKEMGFDGIEFVPFEDLDKSVDPMKTAREVREHCAKIGLDISAYTVGLEFSSEDEEPALSKLYRYIDVAAELGVKTLRHDVCWELPKARFNSYRDAIKLLVPRIRKATEYAAAKGIRTCTENHGYIFQAPERMEELVLAVDHKNYGWLCDVGNFMCSDVDPARAVAIAARYAFHVHVKDFIFKSGDTGICPPDFFGTENGNYLRGTVIGHGVVPIRRCVEILKREGYDGWLSVEFEGMEEPVEAIKASLEYLKKIV